MMFIHALVILALTAGGDDASREQTQAWRDATGAAIERSERFEPPTVVRLPTLSTAAAPSVRSGEVTVDVVVGLGGRAAVARIVQATSEELVPAAIEAAESAEFRPARLDGAPVAVRYEIRYRRTAE
jgi:TonB family protein